MLDDSLASAGLANLGRMFEPWVLIAVALTGLAAGTLGGMLGVGGSVIMIPALVMLFGQGDRNPGFHQHLYQAAAMIVNLAVLLPAARRHYQAGAIQVRALKRIIPFAAVFIIAGVAISNLPLFSPEARFLGASGPVWLGRVLAAFLVYVIAVNVRRLIVGRGETAGQARFDWPRAGGVGVGMGLVAGLMGVGGGAIAVPLQQLLMRLPLRNAIANSATIICFTAGLGAIYKNATLAQHGLDWRNSLLLAGLLAPTAIIGGYLGGRLTHMLPVRIVRVAFIGLMVIAAWKMAGL